MSAQRQRVLLIVDDLGVVWPARHALEAACYEVRWYGDGKTALNALDAFAPELVIVDVMLPGGGGWTVVDTIRALPQAERPRLLVISEAVGLEQTSRIEGLGATAVISRPFEVDQLVAQVARALSRG
ncbi:MAG: response regulator [Actinobacteria bacterium]|nr:MAG: response regulator [Actinomycetota bacterium]